MIPKSKNNMSTLIEILVVIAIISVLAAILFPLFSQGRGGSPDHHGLCSGNQGYIYDKITTYAYDHDEVLPLSSEVWKKIKYDPEYLQCFQDDRNNKNGFLYNNNISGINLSKTKFNPSKKMIIIDGKTTITKGRNIANIYYTTDDVKYRHEKYTVIRYLDGHASIAKSFTEPESWDAQAAIKKKENGK